MRVKNGVLALMIWLGFACVGYAQETGQAAQDQAQSPSAGKPVNMDAQVMAARLVRQPLPVYPMDARRAGVQGTIVIKAMIAKDGSVKDIQVISGPKALRKSATNAVKQFRYRPTMLDGAAVEVRTTISVTFKLS